MSEAKHTAGAWAYQGLAGAHDYAIYEEATGRDIALVRDYHEANARLIAKAPELFALVRRAHENGAFSHVAGLALTVGALLAEIEGKANDEG